MAFDLPDELVIDVYPNRDAAEESALVLRAIGIDCDIDVRSGRFELVVSAAEAERAKRTLAAYASERREPRREMPLAAAPGGTIAGVAAGLLLLAFSLATTVSPGRGWTLKGSAAAAPILAGEWWRVVTALTLHADLSHLVNNAVAIALFGAAVCRWFGPGVGLWLIVVAGGSGNALNALVRGAGHTAIGASTAVFGAIGILTGLQLTRRFATHAGGFAWMRVFAPLAAGLGLLAFLGSSETTDVIAHLFGFACGAPLGMVANKALVEPLPRWLQAVLLLGFGLLLWGCWWLALTR